LPQLISTASAEQSSTNPTPHCAGILFSGKIYNIKCSTFEKTCCCGIYTNGCHAEALTVQSFYGSKITNFFSQFYCKKKEFRTKKKLDVIVIKINKSSQMTNSKCCTICAAILKTFKIRNVFYSNEKGEIIKEKIKYLNPDFVSSGFSFIMDSHFNNNKMKIIFVIKRDLSL
jgi:hypothetical protein